MYEVACDNRSPTNWSLSNEATTDSALHAERPRNCLVVAAHVAGPVTRSAASVELACQQRFPHAIHLFEGLSRN